MNTLFATSMALLAAASIAAQPVVKASDIADYLPTEALVGTYENFEPGASGGNLTWDFSDLQLHASGTCDWMLPSDIGSKNPPKNATLCMAYTGASGENFEFFRHTPYTLEWIGQSFSGQTVGAASRARTIMTFPYTYQTKILNTALDNSGRATVSTSVYDGFGTLIMPYGTHQNVIRQRIEHNGTTDYIWFSTQPFYPILQTDRARKTLGVMMHTAGAGFTSDLSMAITESTCPGVFSIVTKGPGHLRIDDLMGNKVATQESGGGEMTVDLRHCEAGIYLVSLTSGKKYAIRKIVKTSSGGSIPKPESSLTAQVSR